MGNYMDIRYVLFSFLSNCPNDIRKRKLKELQNLHPNEYDEFIEWCRETIQIGEDDLGQEFDDDFKQLFSQNKFKLVFRIQNQFMILM